MDLLVLQTDFGRSDGAVSAMYGVANQVSQTLNIYDLTHGIPQFNIWEASYRLLQTVNYWPKETVFVSVVDPGVGSSRRSIVAKTSTGHYIVSPDNGTLTHLYLHLGIEELRIIDENVNRLPGSSESYTFHGRDVYAYTGARLAAGIINYSEVGPSVDVESLVKLKVDKPELTDTEISGTIDVSDIRYGNLWTNVPRLDFQNLIGYGQDVEVEITHNEQVYYQATLTFDHFFAEVKPGAALIYVNSLDNIALAINQGNFFESLWFGDGH